MRNLFETIDVSFKIDFLLTQPVLLNRNWIFNEFSIGLKGSADNNLMFLTTLTLYLYAWE